MSGQPASVATATVAADQRPADPRALALGRDRDRSERQDGPDRAVVGHERRPRLVTQWPTIRRRPSSMATSDSSGIQRSLVRSRSMIRALVVAGAERGVGQGADGRRRRRAAPADLHRTGRWPAGQPAATTSRRPSGSGRWTVTGRMYAAIISRDPLTPSSVNRYAILRRCAARISSFVASSQSWRLNGPIAFLRVVYTNCWSVWSGLALVGGVGEAPGLDLAVQLVRERRVLVERVLEAGREVDLGGLDGREAVEQLVGQRRRAVLDGARQPVLAGDHAELAQDLEVELDLGDAAAGQRHAAVARPGLDADLARCPVAPGRRASSSRAVAVEVGAQLLDRRVLRADLADLAADADRDAVGLERRG